MEVVIQMQIAIQTIVAVVGSMSVAWLVAMPAEVAAQGRWTNNSEVQWVSFDLDTQLIKALVKTPGRGPDVRRLRKDRPATFQLDLEGASGAKTVIMIDGEEGELAGIPELATVHIHWKPFDDNSYRMRVSKVVYFSAEKLAQREESDE
jgi:hypothetical protein